MSSLKSAGSPVLAPSSPPATATVLEFRAPGDVRHAPRPVPAEGALLRVETTGVCGTDHHIWAGRMDVPAPQPLGHEVIGRLERLPADHGLVSPAPLRAGDRVLVAPGVPCGACPGCHAGGRCHDRPCYGLTMPGDGLTGGFAPLMQLLPGSRVFAVPEELPAERAVFAEPLACVLSALAKACSPDGPPPGVGGLVLGFGVIGICAALAIDAAGGVATVVELDPARRALAAELGYVALASVEEAVAVGTPGGGFPLVVDAAGTPAAFASAIGLLAWGGTLVELGNFADLGEVPVRPSEICLRDLRIVGSGETRYEDFPVALELVAATLTPLERAITDVHRFDALADPGALFSARATGKAMVTFA